MSVVLQAALTRGATLTLGLLFAASCGRIGFDAQGVSGAEEDASFAQDGTVAQQDGTVAQQDASVDAGVPLSLTNPPSLAGTWRVKTMTIDSGGPVVVPRAVSGTGVLGDFELVSTGPTTFDFKSGLLFIDNDLPTEYDLMDGSMAIQPDEMWLVTTGSDVFVVSASLDAGALSLVWEQSDPRNNTSFTPVLASTIEQYPTYAASVAGDWGSASIEYADGDVFTPTGCIRQSATEWEWITMEMHMDSINRYDNTVRQAIFSDVDCQNETSRATEVFVGMAQEDGTRLQIWGSGTDYGPVYFDSELSLIGGNPRIEVTSCKPMPSCTSLSEVIVFAPLP